MSEQEQAPPEQEPPAPETAGTGAGAGDAKPGRSIFSEIVTARPWLVTALAIVLALVIGAILIVVSDQPVLDKFGYFFADPGDALSSAWNDISTAYVALFEGAIFDPSNTSSVSDTLQPLS